MQVFSEVDPLKKVIVHEPDFGIEKVTPEIAEELLYDDIVYLPRMVEEHRVFTGSLKALLGSQNVMDFDHLLETVLNDGALREALLSDLQRLEGIPDRMVDVLADLDPASFGKALVTGYGAAGDVGHLRPLPNLIFTRDLGVAIRDHFVICSANTRARKRESLLSSYVFRFHPLFREMAGAGRIIDLYQAFSGLEQHHSLEGGDMMIVHPDHVLIGCSERSNEPAIRYLANKLLKENIVRHVTRVDIPPKRYCMHLDTIFTMIDRDACVGYAPLVFEANDAVRVVQYRGSINHEVRFGSVRELMTDIYPDMRFIPCGGGISPFQEREQWTDGSNMVALKPGVCYGYERNYHTSEKMKEYGYTMESASLLTDSIVEETGVRKVEQMLITLPSGELSRARGGSHCMTLPVERLSGDEY